MTRLLGYALLALPLLEPAAAFWPFKPKRFAAETLIDAGPLGLEGVKGRVVAVGDWNGDQNSDLFVLSQDGKAVQIHLWDRDAFHFVPSHTITLSQQITNVVPGDFNHDGRLDLLIMYETDSGWWGNKKESIGMKVFLGRAGGSIEETPWDVPESTNVQGIIYDADGSLRPSLLALVEQEGSSDTVLRSWSNSGAGFTVQAPPLQESSEACTLASPHSSAFIDIDGDCLPDLVLHCTRPRSSHHSIQIWLNRGLTGFVLSRTYDLPKGSGPLSFADMNRDGSLDIVFPTCDRHSSSSGVGFDCSINIAYNRQVPLCGTAASQYKGDGSLKCRGWGQLCLADENFEFSLESSSEYFSSIPFADIFAASSGSSDLLAHPPGRSNIPLPLRPGDFNVDGYPDLLLTISNATAVLTGGPFGGHRTGTQVRVLENVPCKKGVAGCTGGGGGGKRGLRVGRGKGWEVLDEVWDVEGASWLDLDDDGSLDIMVQRSGEQTESKVTFIQNNFYHDAFFLKAQVLNGACDGDCQPVDGSKKYSPLGVSYSGATYKFTVLDTLGQRGAQQVAQLPQTGYHALETPYSFIGLGRTNNYVERVSVGASRYPPFHTTDLESIIPNSQLLINPPSPPDNGTSPPSTVRARSTEWRSELYLHPGDWVPWVGAAVVGTVIVLGGVVLGLHEQEKREDEKERRRALHAINFQAL